MKNSFTLEKSKTSESSWIRIQEWNRKWNQKIAIIFCGLCITVLFAIVILSILRSHQEKPFNSTYLPKRNKSSQSNINPSSQQVNRCNLMYDTHIQCTSGFIKNINEDILDALNRSEKLSLSSIQLTLDIYENDIILPTKFYTLDKFIQKLHIFRSKFEQIEDGAFDTFGFDRIVEVQLRDLKLMKLTKNMFVGLKSVRDFSIDQFPLREIESGVMSAFGSSLSNLALYNIKEKYPLNLKNFTGDSEVSAKVIDFRFNDIEILYNDSFNGLADVETLELSGSKIKTLSSQTFQRISNTVRTINLTQNRIERFPKGVFGSIYKNRGVSIQLSNNSIICDCEILDFQKIVKEYPDAFIAFPPRCFDKDLNQEWAEVKDVELECNDRPTTSTSTTTEIPTPPSVEPPDSTEPTSTTELTPSVDPPNSSDTTSTTEISPTPTPPITDPSLLKFRCIDDTSLPDLYYELSSLFLKARSTNFKLFETVDRYLVVEFDKLEPDMCFIWFHNSSKFIEGASISEYFNCISISHKLINITDLSDDINYIFCALYRNENTITPFNCAPYLRTQALPKIWLSEASRVYTISIFVGSIFSAIIIGAIIACCCLKGCCCFAKNQDALRKNRNHPDYHDNYQMPPNYFIDSTHPPQPPPRSFYGTRYGDNIYFGRSLNRRNSQFSAGSNQSYITANAPSPLEVLSFRMDRQRRLNDQNESAIYLERLPEHPPPLPPHPKRLSIPLSQSSSSNASSGGSTNPMSSISYNLQNYYNDRSENESIYH